VPLNKEADRALLYTTLDMNISILRPVKSK